MSVRTRFAPSPTGLLHLGGLRTAVVNYLFAHSQPGGAMLLRIEDTDQSRVVPNGVADIVDTLRWCGIKFEKEPVIQSQRLHLYRQNVKLLLESGAAYPCDCSAERLEGLRAAAKAGGYAPRYDGRCRDAGIKQREAKEAGVHAVRLRLPPGAEESHSDTILLKSDGWPTYHLASVVDDHEMGITHVLRGSEWQASYLLHSVLYDALGWKMPIVRHLPLLVDIYGRKLSKRSKDSSSEYTIKSLKDKGYLAASIVQFVGLFGWTSVHERKIATLDELAADFSLEKLRSSYITADIARLNFFQRLHFTSNPPSTEVMNAIRAEIKNSDKFTDKYLHDVLFALEERFMTAKEAVSKASYFLQDPSYETQNNSLAKEDCARVARIIINYLESCDGKSHANDANIFLEQFLSYCISSLNLNRNKALKILRYILTGVTSGPPISAILRVIGIENGLKRRARILLTKLEEIHRL